MERKLTTIVSMDVVRYSHLMEIDEQGTLARLKSMRSEIVEPATARHGGRTVKLMGDGILVEFPSVVAALQCALDVQRGIAARNASLAENRQLHLRIGLHVGDVMVEGDDLYGDGVNIACRLQALAEPGGITLSEQVRECVGSNIAARFAPLGPLAVKNISRPIVAYRAEFVDRDGGITLRFGEFELDVARFELRKAGERVPIEPQVFDLLLFLARNSQRTVTKEEVFAAIWGERIVSEAALSSQIKAARRAVGDDGVTQHTIATVHGRGFRFVAAIQQAQAATAPDASASAERRSKPSVAVLPFGNLNADAGEDYLADGLAEDITTALAKNRWLAVVARSPAFAFREMRDSIRTVGEKLGADYLVMGSLRRAGTRIRVTVQVVEARTEQSVWSERFDRELVDVFALQEDISRLVASRIEIELGLSEQKKAERRPRQNMGAWDRYQLGVAAFYRFTREANEECEALLRKAIELDDRFAAPCSRLAYAIVLSMVYFDAPATTERLDEALSFAIRAIELDDEDANGYFTLGRVRLARREYELAIDALEHAVTLNPSLAVSYCGLGDSLAYEGRLDEAIQQFDTAIELSPHDPFRWAFFGYRSLAHLFRGEHSEAAAWARRAVQVPNAQYWAFAHLVAALGHLDDHEQAASARENLMRIKPNFSLEFAKERLFYLRRPEQIEAYLAGLRKAGVQ